MSEQAAALPLPPGSQSGTSEREPLLEAGRLTGLGGLARGFAHKLNKPPERLGRPPEAAQ